MKNKITFTIILYLSTMSFVGFAQTSTDLEGYIQEAITSNSALKQKQMSYKKSLLTLKEAKQMFFPTISAVAQYEYNYGGRTINMPFGDMLNPAYDNLDVINQINSSQIPGYPNIPEYPEIENVETQLSPKNQQRTQIEFEMPIYNKALVQNKALQQQIVNINKITANSYQKELIKQVKSAYLDYIIATQTIDIGVKALELVKGSLKISNSLYKNDKITIDEVYKAEAKVIEVENNILEITKGVTLTKAYFNFLLNKKYDADIVISQIFQYENYLIGNIDSLLSMALENRDELKILDHSILIDEINVEMEKSNYLPLFYLNGSTGFWSSDYKFNSDTYFASVSISAKWDIFTSGKTKSKVQQAKIEKQISIEKRKELENNISLEVVDSYFTLVASQNSLALSKSELLNYKESFKIIEKKKLQNMASQIEYDIAFTDYFNAEINYLNNKNKYLQKIIELEFILNNN